MSCPEEKTGKGRLLDAGCEVSEKKQERKQRTLTFCEVCNIQLNSSTQAQIHYNGKTHQQRLRQAKRAKTSHRAGNSTGSQPESSALLTSLPVQPEMDLNYVLPIRMDPVQKAVISHTFSIAQSPKKKQIITCNICHLRFNSTNQAEAHYKGHKHARKLKAIDKLKKTQRILGKSVWSERKREKALSEEMEDTAPICSSQALNPEVSHTPPSEYPCESKRVPASTAPVPPADPERFWDSESRVMGNGNRRKCSRNLGCAVCKVTVNSGSQLQDHYKGSKHRLMLGGHCMLSRKRRGKLDSSRVTPRRKGLPVDTDQSHHCSVCDIDVNSDAQLQQHMSSRRHQDRVSGQSTKFNPYINNSVLTTKLTLQKEFSRTLFSTFLTSALTPATLCATATGPLSLNHLHPQASIIHTPLFSRALFKPVPSPLRAADGPIVFSPY